MYVVLVFFLKLTYSKKKLGGAGEKVKFLSRPWKALKNTDIHINVLG